MSPAVRQDPVTRRRRTPGVTGARALDIALAPGGVHPLFQPIVDLESGETLGYEALARGPVDSDIVSAPELFAAALRAGRQNELEWRCRAEAMHNACLAELGHGLTVFVNVQPGVPCEPIPREHLEVVERATRDLRVVLEITERAVLAEPAELLRTVDWARERGWGIALDDMGADPGSLAMMPFLEPDVIKLDLRLVQQRQDPEIGLIVSAVLAQVERTGATVIAEGIETDAHREVALAMGATLGQGWLYGYPGALPTGGSLPTRTIPLLRTSAGRPELTPYGVVSSAIAVRRGTRSLIEGITGHLEEQAVAWRDGPVVLSTSIAGEELSDHRLNRYERLVSQGSYVVALGLGVTPRIDGGLRCGQLPVDHRLGDEWCVIVVGPHYAGAMVAVARDREPDMRGTASDAYDYAVTHDRSVVIAAGRALLQQLSHDATAAQSL